MVSYDNKTRDLAVPLSQLSAHCELFPPVAPDTMTVLYPI
jgi:hypothetical protein